MAKKKKGFFEDGAEEQSEEAMEEVKLPEPKKPAKKSSKAGIESHSKFDKFKHEGK